MKTGWRVKKSHKKLRFKDGVGQYMKDIDGKLIPVCDIDDVRIVIDDIYVLTIFLKSGKEHDMAYSNDLKTITMQMEMVKKEIEGHRFWLEEEE